MKTDGRWKTEIPAVDDKFTPLNLLIRLLKSAHLRGVNTSTILLSAVKLLEHGNGPTVVHVHVTAVP